MKKLFVSLLAVIMLISLPSCSSNKLSDSFKEEDVIKKAKDVVAVINTLDYEAISQQVREDLRPQLTADTLKTAWDTQLSGAGKFTEFTSSAAIGQKSKTTDEDYAAVVLVCKYEKATLTYTIVLDTNLEVVGLYMK